MKKKYALLSIPLLGVILLLMAYSTGSPGGKSGSPGDNGSTCTQCHSGTVNPVADWISTNIPLTGFVPGNTYTITLTGTHTGVVKFGFEVTAEDGSGTKVGTFILTDPVQTKFTNGNAAVTHTSSGNTPSGNTKTWLVDWTAPVAGTGDVGFYAAFNAANGNGNNSGDVIYNTSLFVSEAVANPEITSIVPGDADQGETISSTISGSGTSWTGSPSVSLSYSGNPAEIITASGVVATNATTITANFTIPTDASPGLWDVNVDALTLQDEFTVNEVVPASIAGIDPNTGDQGAMVLTLITGENTFFTNGVTDVNLSFHDNPSEIIIATSFNTLSNTELEADFDIPSDASDGLWDVNVDNLVMENGFTVIAVTQSLTSIVPDFATQDDMLTTTITASNTSWFGSTPDVLLSSSSNPAETIEASSVTVINDTELEADFTIPTDATVGLWDVNVDMLVMEGGFEVHLLTGIYELSFANLEIYPNPTDGILNLKVDEDVQVELWDISGNRLDGHYVSTGSNVLNLSNRPAGIYFLYVRSETRSEIRKIIIR